MSNSEYKPVIGLEVHIQLKTKSKMFGSAHNNPDEEQPNVNIDEIVTAEPGSLPTANKEAIRLAAKMGLALNCTIDEFSKFDRKHYFYPDLPKGYQISQYDQPIAREGFLEVEVTAETSPPLEEDTSPHPSSRGGAGEVLENSDNGKRDNKSELTTTPSTSPSRGGEKRIKRVLIQRAHLEEDAGKNIHPEGLPYSLVDYNRAGTPLLEIVTHPVIESAEEARKYLEELQRIARYVGASDADMEKGSMRCEPSISVRVPGEEGLPPYKVEVKNINSFKFVEQAIKYEIERQTEMRKNGLIPKQVTMGWNEKENKTVEQRSKEEANDYRYFPEPDLPVLQFTKEYLDELRLEIPELPQAKRKRFKEEYSLPDADIDTLISWKELNYYFESVVSELDAWQASLDPHPAAGHLLPEGEGEIQRSPASFSPSGDRLNGMGFTSIPAQVGDAPLGAERVFDRNKLIKLAANWCLQDFSALLKAQHKNISDALVMPENFAELVMLIDEGTISTSAAKSVFKEMFEKGGEPHSIVRDLGLEQVSDESAIIVVIDQIIAANPKAVEDYKAGQQKSFGFLVGQTMKELKGKGNPQLINDLLIKKLS